MNSSAGSVILTQLLDPGFVHLLEIFTLIGKQCANENTRTFQEVVVSGGISAKMEFSFYLQALQNRLPHEVLLILLNKHTTFL